MAKQSYRTTEGGGAGQGMEPHAWRKQCWRCGPQLKALFRTGRLTALGGFLLLAAFDLAGAFRP